jgi:hypothetical protein
MRLMDSTLRLLTICSSRFLLKDFLKSVAKVMHQQATAARRAHFITKEN